MANVGTEEYSLWVVPPEPVHGRVAGIISGLAEKYGAPSFEPHMTLLGDISTGRRGATKKASELADSLRPFSVRLTDIGCLDTHFRCMFIRAEETPRLMAANERARELFGRQSGQKFMPLISILYGDFPPAMKERIIDEIGVRDGFNAEFKVRSMHLVYSSKKIPINKWRRIKEYTLKAR